MLETQQVPGRPVEAFAIPAAEGDGERVVVLSVAGSPPDEVRSVSLLAVGARPGGPAGRVLAGTPTGFGIPHEVVAIDAGDLDPAPGLEALLVTPSALHIVRLADGAPIRSLPLDPPVTLPPRTRQISRLEAVRTWEGGEQLSALLPTWNGAVLVPLDGRPIQRLPLPVLTDYETMDPSRPVYDGYATARLVWPAIGRADDDGDGVPDLFAASRFELAVFRVGDQGLPPTASRRTRFAPFAFEDERRHQSHTLRAYFHDMDGDGHAEVIEHRSAGSLLESHSTTRVFAGSERGADPSGPHAAELVDDRGFAGIEVFDLEGDGRLEILHNVVPFGMLQLARALTTRRVESELRVFHLPEGPVSQPVSSWQVDLTFPLDFKSQRIKGLLPTPAGDWNGDGLKDLIHGDGPEAVVIRLGRVDDGGPGFGSVAARQELPFSDLALVADVNGDGLDDLVAYDTLDLEGRVVVALNRGRLPGTAPRMGLAPTGR